MKNKIFIGICLIIFNISALNANEDINIKKCIHCHGKDFEKKAMNQSRIVNELSEDEILKSLQGYKDGTYGGRMKDLMKGQIQNFDEVKTLSKYLFENYSILKKEDLNSSINLDQNKTE